MNQKIEPADIIAIILIIGGLLLVGFGINGLIGTLLTAITFYYFGEKHVDNLKK